MPEERKAFEARYARWAAAFYITFALGMAAVLAMMLLGCTDPAPTPAPHTVDLGECIQLAASDGGTAHVYALPEGYPCGQGGQCRLGACTMPETP